MADDGQQLVLTFQLQMERYLRNFEKLSQQTDRRFRVMENRAKQAGERMERSLRASVANINGLLGTLGVGVGLNELRQLAEAWDDISSRVNIAAGDQEKGAAVMGRISEIARRTYSDLGQTAEAYIQNSRALKDLGYSTQTQLDYTEALNNALVVSGAKGQRAESVMNALSKAMASGKLSGDNLNTVIETGGRVAEALANGLGVTVTELRSLGQQGKLTSDVVVKALTGELAKLREQADSMPASITDALMLLRNAMTQYVGQVNEASGVTSMLADGIIVVADILRHGGCSSGRPCDPRQLCADAGARRSRAGRYGRNESLPASGNGHRRGHLRLVGVRRSDSPGRRGYGKPSGLCRRGMGHDQQRRDDCRQHDQRHLDHGHQFHCRCRVRLQGILRGPRRLC